MKQKLLWIVFALATAAQGASLDAGTRYPRELTPAPQEAQAADVLARFHYRKVALDDAFSQGVFDQYLKSRTILSYRVERASVGSTNFDSRSFRVNDEANLNVYDADFAARQIEIVNDDLRH